MADASFTSLTAARLVLRRFRPEDLDAFVAYRSDPRVARYQSWEAPYPEREAHLIESSWWKGQWTNDLGDAILRHEWLARGGAAPESPPEQPQAG